MAVQEMSLVEYFRPSSGTVSRVLIADALSMWRDLPVGVYQPSQNRFMTDVQKSVKNLGSKGNFTNGLNLLDKELDLAIKGMVIPNAMGSARSKGELEEQLVAKGGPLVDAPADVRTNVILDSIGNFAFSDILNGARSPEVIEAIERGKATIGHERFQAYLDYPLVEMAEVDRMLNSALN